MLRLGEFWDLERDASIMLVNNGFLEAEKKKDNYESFFATAQQWVKDVGVTAEKLEAEKKAFETQVAEHEGEFLRIFVKDAERTYRSKSYQETLMHIMTIMEKRLGDYHQGMGLVAGFLLLSLEAHEVLAVLNELATQPKYVPKVWAAESVACATDGYVFQTLLIKHFPDVHAHLVKHFVMPETYVQKWFCSLCVHVLPFEALTVFFTNFMKEGNLFYFKFGLSLIKQVQGAILAAQDTASVYNQLRLDQSNKNMSNELALSILSPESLSYDLGDLGEKLMQLRQELYDKHLKARMESAKNAHAELDNDQAAEVCDFCAGEGEYYCVECKKMICDDCRDRPMAETQHDEDEHQVVDAEDKADFGGGDDADEAVKVVEDMLNKVSLDAEAAE